jgi:hypothetical protein
MKWIPSHDPQMGRDPLFDNMQRICHCPISGCLKVQCHLLRCDAVQSGRNSLTFRRNLVPPCLGSKIKPSKKQTAIWTESSSCLLSIYSPLKMEAVRSSETSVNFYRTAWRHILVVFTVYRWVQQRPSVVPLFNWGCIRLRQDERCFCAIR